MAYLVQDESLTSVADAIRAKGGTAEQLEFPSGFVSAVESISAGLDTSDATATAADILSGKTAYVNGEKITGKISTVTRVIYSSSGSSSGDATVTTSTYTPQYGSSYKKLKVKAPCSTAPTGKNIFDSDNVSLEVEIAPGDFGNATAADVASGKTFTSAAGLLVTGTHECAAPLLQAKTAAPSEAAQTISPDSGYDGLSSVEISAVSSTYVGSGVTQKAAATYTPGTANQTIAAGQYLSGDQTIQGDANLTAANIKSGVSIFGVAGSYTGSGTGGSGLRMTSGTTTSSTIDTGLLTITAMVIYKSSITATGLVQAVWLSEDNSSKFVYCTSYSDYIKSCAASTSSSYGVADGGSFAWEGTGTAGLSSGITYNWIAFGE